jgi:hypothetical protein
MVFFKNKFSLNKICVSLISLSLLMKFHLDLLIKFHLDYRRRTKDRYRLGASPARYSQVSLVETRIHLKGRLSTSGARYTFTDGFLGYLLRGPRSLKFKELVSAFRFRGKKKPHVTKHSEAQRSL